MESASRAQDIELEAKRKRLRQDFSSVPVANSNVRRPPQALQDIGATKSAPKLKFWPPGVQSEVVEANGEGPSTPTALGRPPSSKKKAVGARIKNS